MAGDSEDVRIMSGAILGETIQTHENHKSTTILIKGNGPTVIEAGTDELHLQNLNEPHVPRADHGKEAWLFLLSCFLAEGVIWGFPFSYGVFEAYYGMHEPFHEQETTVATIGTISTGLCYFGSPFAAMVYQAWPQTRRVGVVIGFVLTIVSLVAASYCKDVTGLLATQGVIYSMGALIMYFPIILFIDEWFVSRKGFAYGIMWAGTGIFGAVIPFLMQWLLDRYGYQTALRVWAICATTLLLPCLFLLKPRLLTAPARSFLLKDFSFTKSATFWLFETGVVVQSLGFFLPQLWIPSFALSLGCPTFAGPLSLALISVASAVGSIAMGALVDCVHVTVPILLCAIGSSTAVILFWGLTASRPMLYTFSIFWGTFGGGFVATWSGQAAVIAQSQGPENVYTGLVLSLLAVGKGIGAVVSGPISSRIIDMDWNSHAIFAYGTRYEGLIVFTGISAALGGLPCIGQLSKLLE